MSTHSHWASGHRCRSPFVELSPGLLVDPSEIVAMEGISDMTRIWLRGASAREFIVALKPLHEVVKTVEQALNPARQAPLPELPDPGVPSG